MWFKRNKKNEIVTNNNSEIQKLKDLAYSLIFTNIDKPTSFHIQNLAQNDIKLTTNQIKWLVQKIRQIKYPKDEEFLKDISKITITYENIINMENLPLGYKTAKIINPEKKIN